MKHFRVVLALALLCLFWACGKNNQADPGPGEKLLQVADLEKGLEVISSPELNAYLSRFLEENEAISDLSLLEENPNVLVALVKTEGDLHSFTHPLIRKAQKLFIDEVLPEVEIHKCRTNNVCSDCKFTTDAQGNVNGCGCKPFGGYGGKCSHTVLVIEDK